MQTLNEWMDERDISDTEAAEEIGLSRGYFSRVRTGVVHPSLDTALRIYDWTGGKIDIRSLLPRRLANPRVVNQTPVRIRKSKAA